jgi:hypothetical protein
MEARIRAGASVFVDEDEEEAAWAASSSAMSMARQTSEVRGMRCCRVASCEDTSWSHSMAKAVANVGLLRGRRTIFLVWGWRRGRVSRWISNAPGICGLLLEWESNQKGVREGERENIHFHTVDLLHTDIFPKPLLQRTPLLGRL